MFELHERGAGLVSKPVTAEKALSLIAACEQHDHSPVALEMQVTAYRDLIHETLAPQGLETKFCMNEKCKHADCKRYRDALKNIRPGDAGFLFGLPVRVVPDVPLIRVIEPEDA